ncbi:DUF4054 domain-containing protein [Neisseria polysaccharea]|uniref:DUF4054 domain-containing protein n=1 Tax=Neisseria polysaccharea TaxID=489 RepID=UPI00272B96BF|nr:DUF4054 domain-containing protein [Neisseria polysaccharea]
MPAVVFDKERFQTAYPEVRAAGAQLEMWFTQAESLLDNTDHSIVKKLEEREMLLFLLVRHFAALNERAAQGGLVGRIASAAEGSVSVSADMGAAIGNAAWYLQTPHGATFWQLTAKYRRFRYVSGGCYARRR